MISAKFYLVQISCLTAVILKNMLFFHPRLHKSVGGPGWRNSRRSPGLLVRCETTRASWSYVRHCSRLQRSGRRPNLIHSSWPITSEVQNSGCVTSDIFVAIKRGGRTMVRNARLFHPLTIFLLATTATAKRAHEMSHKWKQNGKLHILRQLEGVHIVWAIGANIFSFHVVRRRAKG